MSAAWGRIRRKASEREIGGGNSVSLWEIRACEKGKRGGSYGKYGTAFQKEFSDTQGTQFSLVKFAEKAKRTQS